MFVPDSRNDSFNSANDYATNAGTISNPPSVIDSVKQGYKSVSESSTAPKTEVANLSHNVTPMNPAQFPQMATESPRKAPRGPTATDTHSSRYNFAVSSKSLSGLPTYGLYG